MADRDEKDIKDGKSEDTAEFFIAEMLFHRHSDSFLDKYNHIKEDIEQAISKRMGELKFKVSEQEKKRLEAGSLNKALKSSLRSVEGLKFEVECKEGVLYDSPKTGGFDFAIFDNQYNVVNFRNFCFGRRAIYDGEAEWGRQLQNREEWKDVAETLELPEMKRRGEDLYHKKAQPTVVGEIQFGNWGLGYYDIIKVIHLEESLEVDLLIYITATGKLQKYLSKSIVTFNRMKKTLEQYGGIVKVPVWLIGLDIRE
ncbi:MULTISPECIES: BglII/BstYI family type II restriction endonuclease [unclassified Bacillus (in: firmicutes)]|uniref:BglII/BstYI family type II restriction endonuclease n=1 Tax=unclassified Bacillus (in: firmicutes) TaxID=185979 RepID=UPI0023DA17FF|nr:MULTISPECIES: BglII/BstYI family type II restriction endonuclease [unclassified Bacillus (in: firmicutes)]MDF2017525.1 hypothetical protein [Bacillus sp. Cr_R3]MDF2030896.1 hypothetical protein [Bacillus sp. Cr_R16]HDR7437547.1 hypothetical protein [Bacillus anthracis]